MTVTPGAMEAILSASSGDLRRATNLLQIAATYTAQVTEETIGSIATTPVQSEVEAMLGEAIRGNFMAARQRLYALFAERGASGEDILRAIHTYLPDISDELVPLRAKIELIDYLGEVNYRLAEGASDRLQLETVLARLARMTATPR